MFVPSRALRKPLPNGYWQLQCCRVLPVPARLRHKFRRQKHLNQTLVDRTVRSQSVDTEQGYNISADTEQARNTQSSTDTDQGAKRYNWEKNWYPVIPVGYLHKDRPTAFQLLGLDLVIWHDGSNWSVLEDACSHRLAPLSEGYIQPEGSLMCSYHGWEFQGNGLCSKIPQIGDPKADKVARGNPRSCVRSFPVQEAWNLIWVWPEAGPDAWLRASTTPPNVPEPVSNPPPTGLRYFSSEEAWSMRETPLDYELLVENILDLSHVPFSHHGVAGRREDAAPSTMSQVGSTSCEAGFVMSTTASDEGAKRRGFLSGVLYFSPPNMVHYSIKQRNSNLYLTSFTTPCAPGKSRYFSRIYTDNKQATPGWLGWLLMRVPPWMVHLSTHNIVDADMILAAGQQRALAARGVTDHLDKAFYCPAIADRAVMVFYKWLSNFSGGRIQYLQPGSSSAALSLPAKLQGSVAREDLLDRWNQHTRHCRFCQDGIALMDRIATAAAAMGILAAMLAVHLAFKASPFQAVSTLIRLAAGQIMQTTNAAPESFMIAPGTLGGCKSILLALLAIVACLVFKKALETKAKFFTGDYKFYDKHLNQ